MKTYFIFVDESGKLRGKDPYYIRSCFFISSEHWRDSRNKFLDLKKIYAIDVQKEFKWSYIWGLKKFQDSGKKITKTCAFYYFRDYDYHDLMKFVEKVLEYLLKYSSVRYLFTISRKSKMTIAQEKTIHEMHIQEIIQRVEMELQEHNDIGVIFHDEVGPKEQKIVCEIYNRIFLSGDYINKYSHIKDGLSIDISSHSYGIQIADFLAGAFMGFMKDYTWSISLLRKYIAPRLRRSVKDYIFGYGIREVPHIPAFRGELMRKFNETEIS